MRYSISTTDAESSAEQKEAVPREAWIGQMRKGVSEGSDPHNFWDSEKQLRFETLLVEISTRFVNLPADQIDGEITNAQHRICELLDFDRSALWQVSTKEQGTGLLTHMHQPSGGPTPPERPDMRDLFPWGSQKVMSGEIVAISKMADLPPEAARDLESFRQYGTKSTLVFPLSTGGGKVLGLLTFAMMREERSWPEMAVKRFQLVAQVFANALARKHADEALRESEERLSLATDSADLGLWIMELDTRRIWVTAKTRELYGFLPEEELTYESFLKVICPEDREQVERAVQQAMLSGEPLRSEFRVLLPDGSISWIGTRGKRYSKSNGDAERLMGVALNITERKLAEEQLRQSYAEIQRLKDRLQAESDYLKAEVEETQSHGEIIGQSATIKKVLRQVEQVAPTDATVLICGETGTGKELIAQAIHRLGPRRSRLMVRVNCAALPSGLVESELFGRERGAFTGAMTRQIGRFEVADGSTIFLDEVGELSFEVQAKLLHVLQEGQFERLGSPRTIKVNVRVIAATNRDLAEDVRKGHFREDLFYRLNVFPIRVPPLRERAEDIPLMIWSFLDEFSSRMGKKITQVPRKTMEALQRHPWPGNVRELRNVIEHGAIVTTGITLKVPMLEDVATPQAAPQSLADAEHAHILKALERTGWRVKGPKGAAAMLDLNPSTLYSRMRKLGIPHRRQKQKGSA